mgnify:FL=1
MWKYDNIDYSQHYGKKVIVAYRDNTTSTINHIYGKLKFITTPQYSQSMLDKDTSHTTYYRKNIVRSGVDMDTWLHENYGVCYLIRELTIAVNDFENHVSIICTNSIEHIYLNRTEETQYLLKLLRPYIEKKTNSDIFNNIALFLTYDHIEI